MAKRIVKFRLITYFEEIPNQVMPNGENVLVERTASMGQEVDLRQADEDRLDSLDALYTAEEAAAIEDGSYNGFDRDTLFAARGGIRPVPLVTAAEGEHGDFNSMDAVALGEYIKEQRLNVESTLALLPQDADEEQIQKLYDAENIALDNEPRKGVTDTLDARLTAVATA